jgi:hypothetical protein
MDLTKRLIRKRIPADSIDLVTDPEELAKYITFAKVEVARLQYPSHCRISKLYDGCMRELVLGNRYELGFSERVTLGKRFMFDKGHAYHRYLQNDPYYFGNNRVGWWSCLACGHARFGLPPTKSCPACNARAKATVYKEHEVRLDAPFRVSGHPDMFLRIGKGDIRTVEIKSIKHEFFEKLKKPMAEHVHQVTGYMVILQHDSTLPVRINPDRGILVYVTKGSPMKNFPMKAFHVKREQYVVDTITSDLTSFTEGVRNAAYTPAPLSICVDGNWLGSTARRCGISGICKEEFLKEMELSDD